MILAEREHPEAAAEFDTAVRWYEAQEPGVGFALIERAQEARRAIITWPNAAPIFTTTNNGTVIRSRGIRGYPYRIVYVTQPGALVILAYAHRRREPGYWLARLG